MVVIKNGEDSQFIPNFNMEEAPFYRDEVINRAEKVFGLKFDELDCLIKVYHTDVGFKFLACFDSVGGIISPSGRMISNFVYKLYEVDFLPGDVHNLN